MVIFSNKFSSKDSSAVVFLTSEQTKDKEFVCSVKEASGAVKSVFAAGKFEGKKGETFPLLVGKSFVLLAGLGKEKDLTSTSLRVVARRAFLSSYFKTAKNIEIVPHKDSADVIKALIDAAVLGTYAWKKYISRKKDDNAVENKNYVIVASSKAEYVEALKIALCANFTRDLINENADVTNAEFLEKTVRSLVKGKGGITLEVLDRRKLQQKKFGLLLAVNRGSSQEPRVVVVKYSGGNKKDPFLAVVGKGLTFDSGGLNLKPSGSMETMREDMSGAAAVIGALKATLELKIRKNIIFAFGAAENAIDANSYKPGDVIVGYAGKSVEIGNTDAEGRLVLADVIAYVIDQYKPARLIDLATLTGACVVGLGHDYAGLMSNDDVLAEAICKSAEATDDRVWRLPLYPELKDMIKSKIADIKNISNKRGSAGSMTAAEFLHAFVGKTPWAHLDIAGTAFVDGDARMYFGHGATGYGVRLLVDFFKKN